MMRDTIKKGALATIVALWASSVFAQGEPASIVIECEHLFDGVSDQATGRTQVLVQGGRIVEVGEAVEAPAGARHIDLSGMTLTPGLIDAHTHITYGWRDTTEAPINLFEVLRGPVLTTFAAAQNAKKTLEAGFTTIRDLGSSDLNALQLGWAIQSGYTPGPSIIAAGQMHLPFGSYRYDVEFPGMGQVASREEIVEKTRWYLSHGADWIKIFATSGTFADTSGVPYFTTDEIRAAVEVAHPRKGWVAAHAMGLEGARRAVDAGVRSLEHGSRLDEKVVKEMAKKKIFLVPTLYHLEWYAQHGEALEYRGDYHGRLDALQEIQFASVQLAREAGVAIACGSDAIYSMHGENAQELVWLVKAGMSPVEALQSATSVNAELLGMENEIGRVAAGYAADLVAFPGNPTSDISVVGNAAFVMKGGEVIKEPQVAAMSRK